MLAGAGSGKTRVVTRRVAHLLAKGVPARSVLALTFTNKAAGEMQSRVAALTPPMGADGLWVTTFHSFGARWLRRELAAAGEVPGAPAGVGPDFTIYDRADQLALVREILQELHLDDRRATPTAIAGLLSRAREEGRGAEDLMRQAPPGRAAGQVFPLYVERLHGANALDFDDLLLAPLAMLEADPDRLRRARERFLYVMVDEFQDTNRRQYDLLVKLAGGHRNLCATGDPDQSIYAFRGADIRNILDFEKDFPEAHVVALEQNYRSTKRILAAASSLISRNLQRREKGLWTENAEGERLRLRVGHDHEQEAAQVASEVEAWRDEGRPLGEAAVFYRTNAQSRALEAAFRARALPYQIVGSVEFFQRREVKDVVAYLRLAQNPRDVASFGRIANVPPRGLGEKGAAALRDLAGRAGIPLADALRRAAEAGLGGRAARGAGELADVLAGIRAAGAAAGADAVQAAVKLSGYESYLRAERDPSAQDRLENVAELATAAADYDRRHPEGGLAGFLEEVALVADVDRMEEEPDRVTFMTLHSSKGLEFPLVAIVGLEEGLLPHSLAQEKPDDVEEERRLLYVGMTRARERLVLARARSRSPFGGPPRPTLGSRFLAEIPPEALDRAAAPPAAVAAPDAGEPDEFGGAPPDAWRYEPDPDSGASDEDGALRAGERVVHPRFGAGSVVGLSGRSPNRRVTVRFDRAGTRELALDLAPLRRSSP